MKALNLTKDQHLRIASLLTALTASIQYQATKDPSLDGLWKEWHDVSKQVSEAAGFEGYLEPSHIRRISITVQ